MYYPEYAHISKTKVGKMSMRLFHHSYYRHQLIHTAWSVVRIMYCVDCVYVHDHSEFITGVITIVSQVHAVNIKITYTIL